MRQLNPMYQLHHRGHAYSTGNQSVLMSESGRPQAAGVKWRFLCPTKGQVANAVLCSDGHMQHTTVFIRSFSVLHVCRCAGGCVM